MGRDWRGQQGESFGELPRFGWRPDIPIEQPVPVNVPEPEPLPPPQSTTTVVLPPPRVQPRPPGRRLGRMPNAGRLARPVFSRLLLHTLVLVTIIAVVAGNGYWNHRPRLALASAPPSSNGNANAPQLGELPTTPGGAASLPARTLSSNSSDVSSGYMTQFSSAVVPDQLQIQVVVAKGGQSIADIAETTGRKINTLLWANGLADPAQPLPDGTQVRVPPVDGMLHVIHDGDTLESIAARYQVDVSAITNYAPNNVHATADLVPYRLLMVPGGTMPTRDKVVTYIVREGDTLATIAQFFGLRANTILWANSLPNGDLIQPGQHLAILPVDGVMVTVKDGDTVESLAGTYGVETKAIREYPANGLGASGILRPGQQVMIPGGKPPKPPEPTPTPEPPPPPAPEPAPAQAQAAPAPEPAPAPAAKPSATGHFIWPASGTITQYFGPTSFYMEPAYLGYAHFHQGLDIANNMYTPLVAVDAGTVTFAGWTNVGYGYAVQIDHGDGLVTWYGHMAQMPAVHTGQTVAQGQYIGPMGSTGASTGSHVHFGVLRNGVWDDPLKYLP